MHRFVSFVGYQLGTLLALSRIKSGTGNFEIMYWRRSLHDDLAMHPGLAAAWYKAGELELTSLGEPLDEPIYFLRCEPLHVRIIVFHFRVLLHLFGVFEIFRSGREHDFVIDLAVVPENKANLLAFADFNAIGNEDHRSVTRVARVPIHNRVFSLCELGAISIRFAERHLTNARWLLRIAWFPGREAAIAVAVARRSGPANAGPAKTVREKRVSKEILIETWLFSSRFIRG
jgi:hypothetical protein